MPADAAGRPRRCGDYLARQKRLAGAVPDDRTILVETFVDPAGELGLAVLTPFGGRLHHALKLALSGRIRQRFGLTPACLHADDGLCSGCRRWTSRRWTCSTA